MSFLYKKYQFLFYKYKKPKIYKKSICWDKNKIFCI